MPHTIEKAVSGRAKCRGCGLAIAKGDLRLGARLPNPFDDEKEMTLWFHLHCGAFKRPGPLLEAVQAKDEALDESTRARLEDEARFTLEHERLSRLHRVERASTGRASCRSCREAIPKGSWRISLVFYDEDEGRFSPAGFIHPRCAKEYFGTGELLSRLKHFSPELKDSDLEEIGSDLTRG